MIGRTSARGAQVPRFVVRFFFATACLPLELNVTKDHGYLYHMGMKHSIRYSTEEVQIKVVETGG